jgi:hypothetical protein
VTATALLLSGLLSGCGLSTRLLTARELGTIVVQVVHTSFATVQAAHGDVRHTSTFASTSTTITATSSTADEQGTFSANSSTAAGFQEFEAGNSLQLYDPTVNTIYETTVPAWQAAITRQMDQNQPSGTRSASRSVTFAYSASPGRMSVFEQQLHAGLYKLAGHTLIDGRAALRLVPARHSISLHRNSGVHQLLGTVYLDPRTYDPIKEVIRASDLAPDFSSTLIERWLAYRVLPASPENLELISLTARHPGARLVHSAKGYLAASNSER